MAPVLDWTSIIQIANLGRLQDKLPPGAEVASARDGEGTLGSPCNARGPFQPESS